jgi:WD40 repeat protein
VNDSYYTNLLENIILPNKILKTSSPFSSSATDDTNLTSPGSRSSPYGTTLSATTTAAAAASVAALEPNIIFATLMNTNETMTCLHLMTDCRQIASGYSDSVIRLWSHNKELGHGGGADEDQLLYEDHQSGYHITPGGGNLTTVLPRAILTSSSLASSASPSHPPVKFYPSSAGSTPNPSSSRPLPGHKNSPTGFPYSLELRGHTQRLLSVCQEEYTTPGRLLISSSADESIRLWDTHLAHCVAKYYSGEGVAWSVSFSPIGYYFLSANQSRTASLFCTERSDALRIFRGHTSDVTCCNWHPNLSYFVTGSDDRTARLWDVRTRAETVRCFSPLAPHASPVNSNTNGMSAVVSSLIASLSPVTAVQVSPCGSMLAVGYEDSTVITWDIPQNKITGILIQETIAATTSSSSSSALSGGGKKKRKQPSSSAAAAAVPSSSAPLPLPSGLSLNHNKFAPIYSLSWSSDSNTLATGSSQGRVNIFNVSAVNYLQLFNQRSPLSATNREVKDTAILISPHHSFITKHTPVYAVSYGTNNLLSAGGALSLPSY